MVGKPTRVVITGFSLKPMPRPRVSRRGGAGFPAAYRMHLRVLRSHMNVFASLVDKNDKIDLIIRVYKPRSPVSRCFGDADNLAKTVLEALPFDDRHVTRLTVEKIFSINPAVEVIAWRSG